jgi:chemotaxis protein MotB
MSRWGLLGIVGFALLAAGCVPSSQYDELKAKYEEEAAKSRRLAEENDRLARALAAKGVNVDDIRRKLDLIDSTGGGGGMGMPIPAPKDSEGFTSLPDGGLRMGALNFRPGSAELTDKAKAALDEVANHLKTRPHFVLVVDGHTDSDPITKSHNASNWELSGKRAAAVVDYLVKVGACKGEDALLRGFSQFRAISDDKAKNRRVDIFAIEAPGAGKSAPAKATGGEEAPAHAPVTPARPATKTAPKPPADDKTLK